MLAKHKGNCKLTAQFLFPKQRGNFSSSLRRTTLESVCIDWACGGPDCQRKPSERKLGSLEPGKPFPIPGLASPGERDLGEDPVYMATGLAVSSRVLRQGPQWAQVREPRTCTCLDLNPAKVKGAGVRKEGKRSGEGE